MLVYSCLLIFATIGWNKVRKQSLDDSVVSNAMNFSPECGGVSVVVAFRNEANNLPVLLSHLTLQDYPKHLVEIILVNDHSTDEWEKVVREYQDICMVINSSGIGKKYAILEGVKRSKYDTIITTDADCRIPKEWICEMEVARTSRKSDLLFGPVKLEGNTSFLSYFQSIDYMAMATIGAGCAGNKQPFLCSGASLMFNKAKYLLVFENIKLEYLSGDDVFLLHVFYERGYSIDFVASQKAIVVSGVQNNFKSLINQRARWGGKATGYRHQFAIFVSLIVLLLNGSLALMFLLFPFNKVFIATGVSVFLFKILIDSVFLNHSKSFWDVKLRVIPTIGSALLYPFWILSVATIGLTRKVQWKGRIE